MDVHVVACRHVIRCMRCPKNHEFTIFKSDWGDGKSIEFLLKSRSQERTCKKMRDFYKLAEGMSIFSRNVFSFS